jgi:hypothetical protein
VLDILIYNFGYTEECLIIDDCFSEYQIEIFEYKTTQRKIKKYYPDIFIPKENKIIEVKSQWWYDGLGHEKYKSRLENNLKKKAAVVAKGYAYELWIFKSPTEYTII